MIRNILKRLWYVLAYILWIATIITVIIPIILWIITGIDMLDNQNQKSFIYLFGFYDE